MDKVALVATLRDPPAPVQPGLESGLLQWLEVRADRVGDLGADWLRRRYGCRLIYALHGSGRHERARRLRRAAEHYDLVELDLRSDLAPEVLDHIPAHQRLISWRGAADDVEALRRCFDRARQAGARYYKLVTVPRVSGEELIPLLLLKTLGRRDVIAFAAGALGMWTRVLAPFMGAPMVVGNLGAANASQGVPSVAQLAADYGFPQLPRVRTVFGIVGAPVMHSLSPRLHNAACREAGLPALYLPFNAPDFDAFWGRVIEGGCFERLGFEVAGFTVGSPHKETALSVSADSAPIVRQAASTNLLIRRANGWRLDSTDPAGVLDNLAERGTPIAGKRIAIVGCGGSGRAMGAALSGRGARVMMVNRGERRGALAARLLDLQLTPLADFEARGFDIVINATPVGRDDDRTPFAVGALGAEAVVVDLAYRAAPTPTPLSRAASACGHTLIDGCDILLAQVRRQYRALTGRRMPASVARLAPAGRPGPASAAAGY